MKYDGTSTSILLGFQQLINNNRSKIPGLQGDWIGIGFMGQSPYTPAISIVPDRWQIIKRYSNNQYVVGRRVEVHLIRDSSTSRNAEKVLRGDVETIHDLLRVDEGFRLKYRGVDQVFNYTPGIVTFESVPSITRYNAIQAVMSFDFLSRAYRPQAREPRQKLRKFVQDQEIFEKVFSSLLARKNSTLARVKGFNAYADPPILTGLSLNVEMVTKDVSEEYQSIDEDTLNFRITVYTKMVKNVESLLLNVEIADKIVDIYESDQTLGGAVFDSQVSSINYTISRNRRDVDLNATQMNLECQKRHSSVDNKILA